MRVYEFETTVSQNMINLPIELDDLNNKKVKVELKIDEENPKGNYDKKALTEAFKELIKHDVFRDIKDPVAWQRELRDEWEERCIR